MRIRIHFAILLVLVGACTAMAKPPEIIEKIVAGRLEKWYADTVLLRQSYIKDDSISVSDLVTNGIAEMGENIVVRRFARFEIGVE